MTRVRRPVPPHTSTWSPHPTFRFAHSPGAHVSFADGASHEPRKHPT